MQNSPLRVGPVFMGTAVANILNPAITSLAGPVGYTQNQPYILLKRVRIVNRLATPQTATLWLGTTGSSNPGQEIYFATNTIAANSFIEEYGNLKIGSADFLTGIASTGNGVVFEGEGEIGISNP